MADGISTAVLKSMYIAEDNRLKCTYCMHRIVKDSLYFREAKQGWRNSHTINLCRNCAGVMLVKFNFDDKEIIQLQKEIILESLKDENEK